MVRATMRIVVQSGLVLAMAGFVRIPSAKVPAAPKPNPPHSEVAPVAPVTRAPQTDAVVFVVLDGARWQEVLVGADPKFATGHDRAERAAKMMPNLHRMIAEGGVVGAPEGGEPMVASGPNFISLPGYTEIFSGRTPSGCADNDCPATKQPTIVDEVRASSSDVAVFASWGPIGRASTAHPDDVVRSTGEAVTGAFRPDRATADEALDYFAEHRPRFMFLGLGEPDEYAHKSDYAGYLGALRQADDVLGEFREVLAEMGERGKNTSIFVTCDHGRSDKFRDHGWPWPESARVWLVASGGAIPNVGVVKSTRKHRLADIAPTARRLLGLDDDRRPGAGAPIEELLPSR